MKLIDYARKFTSLGCPKCGAWAGDPCRTPAWRIAARAHRERVSVIKAVDKAEALLFKPTSTRSQT